MNAENSNNFPLVLENQLTAEVASWQKLQQIVEDPAVSDSDQASKTLDLQKIRQSVAKAGNALVNYIDRFASRLEQLGQRAQNAGVEAGDLKALEYGAAQSGLSNESLAKAVGALKTPGAETLLNRLGVATADANGQKRAESSVFNDLGNSLGAMPEAQAVQTAQQLGLAPDVLAAMQQGLGKFITDYNHISASFDVNMTDAVSGADRFMGARRKFDEVVELLQTKSSARLNDGLADSFDRLSQRLIDNAPDLQRVIDGVVSALLWLAEVGERVVIRLVQAAADLSRWWDSLDGATKQLLISLGAVTAAWLVLNSAFLMSPLGIVLALAGALFALYDDYKTWQEGGKSLIDWDSWAPGIQAAKTAIGWLIDKIAKLSQGTLDWKSGMQALADFVSGNWSPTMINAVKSVKEYFNSFFADIANKLADGPAWTLLRKLHILTDKDTEDMIHFMSNMFGGDDKASAGSASQANRQIFNPTYLSNAMATINATGNDRMLWQNALMQPAGPGIQQETNIHLHGVSDPQAAAKYVERSQFDVNSLLVQKLARRAV
ncbi:hypothetical protein AAGQ96_16055 [Pantoea sp. MBD-2R]|uniref:hypothetical protein n=1 Tax=Pantoea sp. MBD-2R TaxID=3141540 RepID=UPI00318468DC